MSDVLKNEFVPRFLTAGEEEFVKFLLLYAVKKLAAIEKESYDGMTPDLEFLDYYDKFMVLYRRESQDVYLKMAKVFRKTAHRIYRIMLKKNMTHINYKFLNLVYNGSY